MCDTDYRGISKGIGVILCEMMRIECAFISRVMIFPSLVTYLNFPLFQVTCIIDSPSFIQYPPNNSLSNSTK